MFESRKAWDGFVKFSMVVVVEPAKVTSPRTLVAKKLNAKRLRCMLGVWGTENFIFSVSLWLLVLGPVTETDQT